jgi:hypothetical protein
VADADPGMIHVRRRTVVRAGVVLGMFAAVGIGFALGWVVFHPTTAPARPGEATGALRGAPIHNGIIPGRLRINTTTTEPLITTSTTSPLRRILAPATTEPVSDECSIPITQTADGNPDPATCPGGGVNVLAWNYMAKNYPSILGLGANATEAQVFQAMCTAPNPVGGEFSLTAQEAATYYGWSFAGALNNWYPGDPTYCSG